MSSQERAVRIRRNRSATESLLSIVLGLEAVLLFFVTLAVFRFAVLPPAAAFIGGAVVIVVLLILGRLLRFCAGLVAGWVAQVALIAIGFLLPLMFFIGAGFTAIWVYCFITGVRLDRRNATLRAAAAADQSIPSSSTQAEEQS